MFTFFRKPKIGIDIVDVLRFRGFTKNDPFIQKTFSVYEQEYCFSHTDPSSHLAGIFAAKEATSKALGTDTYIIYELEVRHTDNGVPGMFFKNKPLSISVSISHTDTVAIACAVG